MVVPAIVLVPFDGIMTRDFSLLLGTTSISVARLLVTTTSPLVAKMIVVFMAIRIEYLGQNVHQSDVSECTHGNQQGKARPPVELLLTIGVIDGGLGLGSEDCERNEGAQRARC